MKRQTIDQVSATAALDYDSTMIGALELSSKKWVFAVQLPGSRKHTRHAVEPNGPVLETLLEKLKANNALSGRPISRVIMTHEAGRDGFWLARFLQRRGVEVQVMQASSLPVDRRARRAKTDVIDAEMLLRTLLAWLRGEPRVCSMVPIPSEADEEARRAHREREDLLGERRSLLNRIDGILATLGIIDFKGLRRDRRKQLDDLRQPDGAKIPAAAQSRIERLVERLELVMAQLATVEAARDAVVKKETPANSSERMIRDLSRVCGIGVESATLLVREAFCRNFANRGALGSYAGLTATPFASGSMTREQGISKDGNRRLRVCLVELAWLWLRYQRESGLAQWFCTRVNGAKGRVAKIMIVALARKLLIALWRFAKEGVILEGATMKTA
ncbi:MAG: IS110 family transposase [Methylocystis silviterrae]